MQYQGRLRRHRLRICYQDLQLYTPLFPPRFVLDHRLGVCFARCRLSKPIVWTFSIISHSWICTREKLERPTYRTITTLDIWDSIPRPHPQVGLAQ